MEESFGHYRIEASLGRGGMGEVHRAVDTRRERTVALKRLHRDLAADPEFRERFKRESRLAARLSSPHVIPIHDFGEIDGRLYLDMRLVTGRDLGAVIREDGALDPRRAVDLVGQIASALDAAHEGGLVHRDVKPSNVLVTGGGSREFAYLVDFGIVRALDGSGGTSLTGTGITIGTFAYIAPELLAGGRGTVRSDVYALACLLHEALTGQTPFGNGSIPSLMYHHVHSEPPRASQLNPDVPAAFDAVIARGMAKDPDRRAASAGALADEAAAVLRDGGAPRTTTPYASPSAGPGGAGPGGAGPGGAGPAGTPSTPPAAPDPSRRRRVALVGALGALALVVVLVAVVALVRGQNQDQAQDRNQDPTTRPAPTSTPAAIAPSAISLAGQTYTVGGRDFDEQLVLCTMSSLLLRARGATVNDRCNTSGSAANRQALVSGQVDLEWEYTGTGWTVDLQRSPPIPDAQRQYEAVRDADAGNGLTWLAPSAFNNTYGIAARAGTLRSLNVHTVSDLARLANSGSNQATLCVEADFGTRDDGLPGMLQTYGIPRTIPTTTLDTGAIYQAVATGTPCAFGEVFTTDGRLPGLDLQTLVDDRHFFPYYNASPVFRTAALARQPALRGLFEDVARRLTDPVMLGLNGQVSSQGRDPEAVADDWLRSQGLI